MKFREILIALVVFLALMPLCSAQIIGEINLNVSGSGVVFVSEDFSVLENETYVDFTLPPYSNLEVSSLGVNVPYTIKNVDTGFRVDLDFSNLHSGTKLIDVLMMYETQHLTSKNGSVWSISFSTKTTPRKTLIKLFLPKNSTILSLQPRNVFFSSIDKDVLWLYPQESEFNFTLNYEYTGGPVVVVPEGEDNSVLILAFVLLLSAAFIVLAYYLIKKRVSSRVVGKLEMEKEVVSSGEQVTLPEEAAKKASDIGGIEFEFKTEKSTPKIKSTVFNVLDEDERGILSLIQDHGPEDITQAFIYKTTRMPKSSLSEIVKRLEKRNVIECRREGRVNWIKLKKWVLE
ncbi:MAG: MarR family transcriptional regulator [Candidatus Altiarchaeota archaeon]